MRSPRTATKSSPRSPQLQKARAQQRRLNTAKNKFKKEKKNFSNIHITGEFYGCLSSPGLPHHGHKYNLKTSLPTFPRLFPLLPLIGGH